MLKVLCHPIWLDRRDHLIRSSRAIVVIKMWSKRCVKLISNRVNMQRCLLLEGKQLQTNLTKHQQLILPNKHLPSTADKLQEPVAPKNWASPIVSELTFSHHTIHSRRRDREAVLEMLDRRVEVRTLISKITLNSLGKNQFKTIHIITKGRKTIWILVNSIL